jgi:tetratricopeptide (TPR) repeat protein
MSRNKVNTMSPADFNDLNKATLEKDLQETKDRIANIKSMGADVEAAEIIMAQAEKALEEGNLEMTKAMIDSTIRTFTLIKQQYFIQAASILFSSLQRSIVSLEGAGSEVNYIKDLYNRAKEKFDSGQYEEAMDYIKSAEDMVNDLTDSLPEEHRPPATEDVVVEEEAALKEQLTFEYDRSQEQMERVSQVLIRVEKLLQEAIVAGYSVNEAEKLYSLAEDAFDYQDYKKAEEYSLQCESSLEEILRPLHEAQTRVAEEGGTIEPPEEQKAIREDIPTGNRFTNKDKGLSDIMPKGIIGDAPKAEQQEVKTPEEKAIDLELAVEKEATNLLITADEKITMAKDSGLNIPMAERLLSIGESYFDRGEFDKVKEYVSLLNRKMKHHPKKSQMKM